MPVDATLADYWPFLCPSLPTPWDTPANRESLFRAARSMAPIPRIAMECRLNQPAPALDLQQCITRDNGEPALLRDFLRSTQPAEGAWAGLHRFCEAWADAASDLHRGVAEVFLEYDVGGTTGETLTPSLFFSVDEGSPVAPAVLSALLGDPLPSALAINLERCSAACPAGAYVGYLGVMLGRTAEAVQAVRVNVKKLRLADFAVYLDAVGWPGSAHALETWAAWAYDWVDQVTVCLDVGEVVYPHVGLECLLTNQPQAEPRWRALLDELVAAGLCAAENAKAFESLPSALLPPATELGWPAAWIAGTLQRPAGHFSTTERRLSHVKVAVAEPDVSVKGYWGAGHVWRTASPPGWGDAVARGVAFLVANQSHTGRWSDFLLPAGPSDEWVTAFVGACLLDVGTTAALHAAERAWQALLARRHDEPGWGYNRLTPADADSTAWALRLAAGLGATGERMAAAAEFLTEHVVAGGGVMTYAAGGPIRRFVDLPGDASVEGWQAAHACVTAAAAPLVGSPATGYLASAQAPLGNWQGYWWSDDEYTTALAVEVVPEAQARARAATWAETRLGVGGTSPWATAWCLRILRQTDTPEARAACERAVAWLTDSQLGDGSWSASARLRVPMPAHLDPAGHQKRIDALDEQRVFTTAAVVAALSLASSR